MTSPDPRATLADELLPCPFCGKAPKNTEYFGNYNKSSWVVHCAACDVSLNGDATPEEAAKRWNTRSPSPYSGAAELAAKIANSEASCFMLDAQQKQIVVAVLTAATNQSDGQGVRQEDTARFHGESLQQGPDTSSNPSTAATMSHGKRSGAASIANPAAVSDRASHTATGPSDLNIVPAPSLPRDSERETIERIIENKMLQIPDTGTMAFQQRRTKELSVEAADAILALPSIPLQRPKRDDSWVLDTARELRRVLISKYRYGVRWRNWHANEIVNAIDGFLFILPIPSDPYPTSVMPKDPK